MNRRLRVAHVATVDLTLRFLLLGQLRALVQEGYEVAAISAPGPWTEELEAEGIRHIPWPHATRAWHPTRDVRASEELRRIFLRERFDLAHTHTPKPGVIGRIVARLADVPCVVNTVHGYFTAPDDPAARRIPVREVERFAARFSDLELFQSQEDLRWALRERIVRPAQAVYLGNGTDLQRFDPTTLDRGHLDALRRELGIPRSAVVVGTVGRLVAEKGHRQFIEAARIVRSTIPGTKFLVVGGIDSDKGDRLTRGEIERSAADVIFTGWRQDIPALLSLMDVFVLASWREGMPRSAIEAAAMGKPLVLTDIRGCREIVRDGIEGLIVPARRSVPLAEAIHRLATDPRSRDQMGAAARTRVVERFDEQRVFETIAVHYHALLSAKALPFSGWRKGETTIRPARRADAVRMAALHRRTLDGAFLPMLGERFLRELYRAVVTTPGAIAFVAERNGTICGFATGVRSVDRFYRRFLLHHGFRAAIAAAPRLARPDVLWRVIETLRYPVVSDRLPEPELLSICMEPRARRRGTGQNLAAEVIRGLADLGARRVKVVVDAENRPANRLYESLGFLPGPFISVHRGTMSRVWVIECRSSSRSGSRSS